MFFVNNYSGPGVSIPQYGFGWINGNGVSVQQSVFNLPPRYDTLAHEIGHALALTHQNFGAPLLPTNNNLMQLGTDRATSYNSGCQRLAGTFSTRPPVYYNGALYDLDYNTSIFLPCKDANGIPIGNALADQLFLQSELIPPATSSACPTPLDPSTCFTQQGAAALSPFINRTLPNTANAGGGLPFASAMTTTTSSSGTPAPLIITISVGGEPNTGIPDLAYSIIALPANDSLSFSGTRPVTQIGGTGCDVNHIPNGCVVTLTDATKLSNQQLTGNPGCDGGTGQPPSAQCIKLTYSARFGPDNPAVAPTNNNPAINVILAVNFNKDSTTIINNNLLAGAQYTAVDNKGFATTSLFGNAVNQVFTANSQFPDLTTPNVLLDPAGFQNASVVKLIGPNPPNDPVALKKLRKLAQCTPPYTTVFERIRGQLVPATVCPDGNLPDGPD
jgi:hypothetical protein